MVQAQNGYKATCTSVGESIVDAARARPKVGTAFLPARHTPLPRTPAANRASSLTYARCARLPRSGPPANTSPSAP